LSRIIEITGDKSVYVDREALQSLKTASMEDNGNNFHVSSQIMKKLIQLNTEGVVFKLPDLYFYRGVYKFYLKNYDKAIENWTVSYTLK
jgi:hypothetical protein